MVYLIIVLAVVALVLLGLLVRRMLAEDNGQPSSIDRAKQRAVIRMTAERLLAEERIRYVLQRYGRRSR